MTIKYSFNLESKIDDNLTAAWKNSDNYEHNSENWLRFVQSVVEVEAASYDKDKEISHLTFTDESALSLFLLRWS